MMCLSSLAFVYFFSLFWRDEDSGTKILLSSIFISALVMGFIYAYILMPLSSRSDFFKEIFIFYVDIYPKEETSKPQITSEEWLAGNDIKQKNKEFMDKIDEAIDDIK